MSIMNIIFQIQGDKHFDRDRTRLIATKPVLPHGVLLKITEYIPDVKTSSTKNSKKKI